MNIYIVTYRRPQTQHTLKDITRSKKVLDRVVFVVDKDEEAIIKRTWPMVKNVMAVPTEGLSKKRERIFKAAKANGEKKLIMLDDDLYFYHRLNHGKIPKTPPGTPSVAQPELTNNEQNQLRRNTPEQTEAIFNDVAALLNHWAHVSISPREGNNRLDGAGYPLVLNKRAMRALAFRVDIATEVFGTKIARTPVMMDFDMQLRLIRAGYDHAMLTMYAQGQPKTQSKGGCSVYRTTSMQEYTANELAKLHPGFVSLRQKDNIGGGEFGKRTDVTIHWAKAAASAPRRKL